MGDFNADMENVSLKHFCDLYNLKNLIKVPTCFKNPENPKCIDLMLTRSYRSFQNSCAIETGLSDFHKMIVTVMKAYFQKQKPKVITYRDYKNFSENDYRQQITYKLSLIGHANEIPFDIFMTTCTKTLDKAAPVKQKYVRSNQSPFLNKQILKAIMNRARLRNTFLRTRSAEDRFAYNQQRNFCLSLIRKAKKDYYNNLDHKKVTDNKSFWKTVKPLFSDKISSLSKFTLIENELQLNDDENISSVWNDFFSNVVSSLNIPPYKDPSVNPDQFEDPVLKANEKYKNHPSIKAIKERNINKVFKFQSISRSNIKKESLSLDSSKASQESDTPTKIIKQNVDIFTEHLFHEFEKSLFEKF